jgi:hypothetical protein
MVVHSDAHTDVTFPERGEGGRISKSLVFPIFAAVHSGVYTMECYRVMGLNTTRASGFADGDLH